MVFFRSAMVVSKSLSEIATPSSSALVTLSQSSSANSGAGAASTPKSAAVAAAVISIRPFVRPAAAVRDRASAMAGSFAVLVDLGLQLPDRAVETRQRLGALIALVEAFVDDDAERLDQPEPLAKGGARRGGIVAALGRRIGLVDQHLHALGHALALVGARRGGGAADHGCEHERSPHRMDRDHGVSSTRRAAHYRERPCLSRRRRDRRVRFS